MICCHHAHLVYLMDVCTSYVSRLLAFMYVIWSVCPDVHVTNIPRTNHDCWRLLHQHRVLYEIINSQKLWFSYPIITHYNHIVHVDIVLSNMVIIVVFVDYCSTLPGFVSWVQYTSWYRYGNEILVVNQWKDVGNISK